MSATESRGRLCVGQIRRPACVPLSPGLQVVDDLFVPVSDGLLSANRFGVKNEDSSTVSDIARFKLKHYALEVPSDPAQPAVISL
jgi:hypothetical protein